MNLSQLLHPDCVKVPLEATDKQAAVFELIDVLADQGLVSNAEAVRAAVWQRESTRSTGIGHGLAIPHGKTSAVDKLVMAVGVPKEPLEFESLDKQPVRLIFLLASPPDQTGPHIQALAQVSRLMADTSVREAAFKAEDSQALFSLIASTDPQAAT